MTIDGEETVKSALISSEGESEWKLFQALLAQKQQDDIPAQTKELLTIEMLIAMFPNLSKLASIAVTIPVSTASVERSFSHMELIKTRLRNSLCEGCLSQLMRIATESPEKLTESELEEVVKIWNRKPRRVTV